MREIKFRYRLKNKETDNIFVDIVTLEQLENGYFEHHGYYHEGEWRWLILSRDLYTGLKDSKRTKEFPEGQGIYENDILNQEGNISIVEWNDRFAEFNTSYGDINKYTAEHDCKVIGNIYENKELLKGE